MAIRATEAALENTFAKIARIIAARHGIKVRIQGGSAYVNLDTAEITLPSLSSNSVKRVVAFLDGFLDHEVAHVKFTENLDLKAVCEGVAELQWVFNALEDVRIEKAMGAEYPGCKRNLDNLRHHLDKQMRADWDERDGFNKVLYALQRCWIGDDVSDWVDQPDVHAVLQCLLPEIAAGRRVASTTEALAVAKQVWEKLKDLSDPQPQDDQEQDGGESSNGSGDDDDDQGESSSSDDQGEGDDRGHGDDSEGDTGESDASEGDSGDERLAQDMAQSIMQKAEAGNTQQPPDVESMMNSVVEYDDTPGQPEDYLIFSEEWDTEVTYTAEQRRRHNSAYEELKNKVRGYIGNMGAMLEASLMAQQERRWVAGAKRGRKFDRRRVSRWMEGCNEEALFRQRETSEWEDTAVVLLWDGSGSMGSSKNEGTRSYVARLAAIAFHEALLRTNVPHEVLGFDTGGIVPEGLRRAVKEARNRGEDLNRYSRIDDTDNRYVFVPFGQKDGRALVNITGRGCNRDGECVLWAAKRLAQRSESRKVLIVGSDGQPCGAEHDYTERKYLREVVEKIRASGIEVYGIGIQSDAVKDYYPEYTVLEEIEQLPRAVLGWLQQRLGRRQGTGDACNAGARL